MTNRGLWKPSVAILLVLAMTTSLSIANAESVTGVPYLPQVPLKAGDAVVIHTQSPAKKSITVNLSENVGVAESNQPPGQNQASQLVKSSTQIQVNLSESMSIKLGNNSNGMFSVVKRTSEFQATLDRISDLTRIKVHGKEASNISEWNHQETVTPSTLLKNPGQDLANVVSGLENELEGSFHASHVGNYGAIISGALPSGSKIITETYAVEKLAWQVAHDTIDPKDPLVFLILIPLSGFILAKSENEKFRISNPRKILSVFFIVIIASSAFATPFSFYPRFISAAYADRGGEQNNTGNRANDTSGNSSKLGFSEFSNGTQGNNLSFDKFSNATANSNSTLSVTGFSNATSNLSFNKFSNSTREGNSTNSSSNLPGLISSWKFSNANISSTSVGDAQVGNSSGTTSLELDGNGYLKQNVNSTANLSDLTLSAWVNPDYSQGSSQFTVISKGDTFILGINNNMPPAKTAFFSVFDGIRWNTITSNSTIPQDWTHLASTFNGTTITLYVNGRQEATGQLSGVPTIALNGQLTTKTVNDLSSKADVLIGAYMGDRGTPSNLFSGSIEGVNLYGSLLSPSQIAYLYQSNPLSENSTAPVQLPSPLPVKAPSNSTIQNGTLANSTPMQNGTLANSTPIQNGTLANSTQGIAFGFSNATSVLNSTLANSTLANSTNDTAIPVTTSVANTKDSYLITENPELKFQYFASSDLKKFKRPLADSPGEMQTGGWKGHNGKITISVIGPDGSVVPLKSTFQKLRDGKFDIKLGSHRYGKPGLYRVVIKLERDGKTYTIQDQFTWGLVSANTQKSIYRPGETANFTIAVLDNGGHSVCNANISMDIKGPNGVASLSSGNGITPELQCGLYDAQYQTGPEGNYTVGITAQNPSGVATFNTSFLVQNSYAFDIIRTADSKIDPIDDPNLYTVRINITSLEGAGNVTIQESVPSVFNVTTDAKVQTVGDTKMLTWNRGLVGDNTLVQYTYSVPLQYPQLYSLGPVQITYGSGQVFNEARSWFVAVDPAGPGNTITFKAPMISSDSSIATTTVVADFCTANCTPKLSGGAGQTQVKKSSLGSGVGSVASNTAVHFIWITSPSISETWVKSTCTTGTCTSANPTSFTMPNAAETVTANYGVTEKLTETLTSSDAIKLNATYVRTLPETMTSTDALSRIYSSTQTAQETLSSTDGMVTSPPTISIQNPVISASGTVSSNSFTLSGVTVPSYATNNELVLSIALSSGTVSTGINSPTWSGGGCTFTQSAVRTNTIDAEIWYCKNPTAATGGTVTVNTSSGTAQYVASLYVLDGVSQTINPTAYASTSGSTGTSMSQAITQSGSANYNIDSFAINGGDGSAVAPTASNNERLGSTPLSTSASLTGASSYQNPPTSSMGYSWTTSGAKWSWVAIAVPRAGVSTTKVITESMSSTEGLSTTHVIPPQVLTESMSSTEGLSTTHVIPPQVLTESLSATDAVNKTHIIPPQTLGESLSATDTASTVHLVNQMLSESLSATDAVNRTHTIPPQTLIETLSATDGLSRTHTLPAEVLTESLSTTDAASAVHLAIQPIPESLSSTDAIARTLNATQTLQESLSATDAVSRTHGLPVQTLSESISATDSASAVHLAIQTIPELLSSSDSASRILNATQTVSESLSSTDAVSRAHGLPVQTLSETLAATDAVNRTHTIPPQLLNESLSSADQVSRSRVIPPLVISETVSSSDAASTTYLAVQTISETLSATESANRTHTIPPQTLSESLSSADAVSRAHGLPVQTLSESFSSSDSASMILNATQTLSESLSQSDAVNGTHSAIQVISEALGISDAATRGHLTTETLSETVSSADAETLKGGIRIEARDQNGNLVPDATYSISPSPDGSNTPLSVVDGGANDADGINNGRSVVTLVPFGPYNITITTIPPGYNVLGNYTIFTVSPTNPNGIALFRVTPVSTNLSMLPPTVITSAPNLNDTVLNTWISSFGAHLHNGTQPVTPITSVPQLPPIISAGASNATAVAKAVSQQATVQLDTNFGPGQDPSSIISALGVPVYSVPKTPDVVSVIPSIVAQSANLNVPTQTVTTPPLDRIVPGQQMIMPVNPAVIPNTGGLKQLDITSSPTAATGNATSDWFVVKVDNTVPSTLPPLSASGIKDKAVLYVNVTYQWEVTSPHKGFDWSNPANFASPPHLTLQLPKPGTNSGIQTDSNGCPVSDIYLYDPSTASWTTNTVSVISAAPTAGNPSTCDVVVQAHHFSSFALGSPGTSGAGPAPAPDPSSAVSGGFGGGGGGGAGPSSSSSGPSSSGEGFGGILAPVLKIDSVTYNTCQNQTVTMLVEYSDSNPSVILRTSLTGVVQASVASYQPYAAENANSTIQRIVYEAPINPREQSFEVVALQAAGNNVNSVGQTIEITGCAETVNFGNAPGAQPAAVDESAPQIFDVRFQPGNGTMETSNGSNQFASPQPVTVTAIVSSPTPIDQAQLKFVRAGDVPSTFEMIPMNISPLPIANTTYTVTGTIPQQMLSSPATTYWVDVHNTAQKTSDSETYTLGIVPPYPVQGNLQMDMNPSRAQGTSMHPVAYLNNTSQGPVWGSVSLVSNGSVVYTSPPQLFGTGQTPVTLEWEVPNMGAVADYKMSAVADIYGQSFGTVLGDLDTFQSVQTMPISSATAISTISEGNSTIAQAAVLYSSFRNDGTMRYTVTAHDGTCVIGGAGGCLVTNSTYGQRGDFKAVNVGGEAYLVRYSGPGDALERFSITSVDPILGQWKVDLVSQSGLLPQAQAAGGVFLKVKYDESNRTLVTLPSGQP